MPSLSQKIRNRALRVAFLTNSAFQLENALAKGALKKRALRVIERNIRHAVIESSDQPDVIFYIQRVPGGKSWQLRRAK